MYTCTFNFIHQPCINRKPYFIKKYNIVKKDIFEAMNTEVRKIFYTDDDIDDRNIFIDAANEVSHFLQIITQSSGDELIRLLANPPPYPNLIFLDLNMPIKNGYEVLQEIKQSDRTKNFPVIVFSTSDDEKIINATRLLGANLYIPKPSSFSSLKKVIKHSLSINWDAFTPSTENFIYRAN
jgi:response regulator RpfG family c-di-GMP phosphodiesterase